MVATGITVSIDTDSSLNTATFRLHLRSAKKSTTVRMRRYTIWTATSICNSNFSSLFKHKEIVSKPREKNTNKQEWLTIYTLYIAIVNCYPLRGEEGKYENGFDMERLVLIESEIWVEIWLCMCVYIYDMWLLRRCETCFLNLRFVPLYRISDFYQLLKYLYIFFW